MVESMSATSSRLRRLASGTSAASIGRRVDDAAGDAERVGVLGLDDLAGDAVVEPVDLAADLMVDRLRRALASSAGSAGLAMRQRTDMTGSGGLADDGV